MDDKRFDQITRALGGVSGRRQAVKSIFGGAVATGLGALGLAEAAAKNKAKGKGKGKQGKKSGGQNDDHCRPEGHPCKTEPNACCPDLICGAAPNHGADIRCCAPGADCLPICGDNGPCGDGEVCCEGQCVSGVCCNTGDCNAKSKSKGKGKSAKGKRGVAGGAEHCCDNQCVDTDTDSQNCGRCGNACDQDETCVDGKCTSQGQCSDENPCSGDQTCCGGTCVTCPTGGVCDGTTCGCPDGQIDCDGTCVTGVCCTAQDCQPGDICNDDHQCVTPTCDPACDTGLTCCGGNTCVNTDTDADNCGGCGNVCPSGDSCVAGACTAGGGCTSDADCQPNGLCLIDGTCFFPNTCPVGETNFDCCKNAVKKACRHRGGSKSPHGNGHQCRKKGKRRCKKNFGDS